MLVVWLAAIAGLVALGVRHWQAGRVTLTFVHATGAVPPLELTVFADRLTFTGPSPPAALGQRQVEGASATLAGDLVPERAVVRYRGDGVGAGIVFVTLGDDIAPIELGPARTIRGSVVEPLGFWAFGWRPAGTRAVGGAEIIAMAGGEQGIEIARTVADENGDFVLPGIAAAVDALSLRVRAPGFELGHVDVSTHRPRTSADPDIVVAPVRRTKPVRGRVLGPDDVDLEGLWVLARGLPGVQVRPDADGTFELDHVPPRAQLRLLVHGLGPFFACADVRAEPGSVPELRIVPAGLVRGRVVDHETGEPIAGALVYAKNTATVRTDVHGHFELPHIEPGRVEVITQVETRTKKRRRQVRFGRADVDVRAGAEQAGVEIQVH